jgi:hypothetical protein
MHLRLLKLDRSPVCTVCPESFQHLVLTSNPIATKPCNGKDHMSNQRKAEIIIGNFCIQSFKEGHGKILPNADLCPKVKSAQFSPNQPPGHSLIAITHNPLTVWSYEMIHREVGRATYEAVTRQSGSFSLFNLRNFVSSNYCAVQFSFQQVC